jgi:hypothetical protein
MGSYEYKNENSASMKDRVCTEHLSDYQALKKNINALDLSKYDPRFGFVFTVKVI